MEHDHKSPAHRFGFFQLLSGKPLRERASSLVDSFSETCRPVGAKGRTPSTRQIELALERMYRGAAEFSSTQRLTTLGRARFAKAVQDELLRRGYSGDVVTKITSALAAKALSTRSAMKSGEAGRKKAAD